MKRFTKNQWVSTYPAEFETIRKKLDKFRSRCYIAGGTVLSLTALFYIPKVEDAIRLVYDLMSSGLNGELWDPTFWMPSL